MLYKFGTPSPLHIKRVSRVFQRQKFPDINNPAIDLTSQLIKLYDGLQSGRYSVPGSLKGDDYQLGIKPSTFKNLIGENHPEFKTQRQQDAFEFCYIFLTKWIMNWD